jgi:flagellar motor switch protein FliN/FliY
MTLNSPSTSTGQWLLKEWCLRLSQSIEAMTGKPGHVTEKPASTPPPGVASWWVQPFSLAPDCRVWIGAPPSSQQLIGKMILAGAGIEDCSEEDRTSTYKEILQQALAGLAHGLSGLIGREVTASEPEDSADAPPLAVLLDLVLAGEPPTQMLIGWTEQTLKRIEFQAAPAPPSPSKSEPSAKPVAPEPTAADSPPRTPTVTRTLELLYDVELPVAVSFGRAHLALKEVLKLTSGSIIELNRTVTEPVEIIINNCVIARGEVVVVDGNYGVRIQQIISKSERLRTLH